MIYKIFVAMYPDDYIFPKQYEPYKNDCDWHCKFNSEQWGEPLCELIEKGEECPFRNKNWGDITPSTEFGDLPKEIQEKVERLADEINK